MRELLSSCSPDEVGSGRECRPPRHMLRQTQNLPSVHMVLRLRTY